MAVLTKEELIAKVNEKLADNNELAIELMEDITDSFKDVDLSGYVEKVVYDELVQKYKDRFMNPEEMKDEVIDEEEKVETEEDNVVDVTEIFEEKKEDEE